MEKIKQHQLRVIMWLGEESKTAEITQKGTPMKFKAFLAGFFILFELYSLIVRIGKKYSITNNYTKNSPDARRNLEL